MNKNIQDKIERYKKMAKSQGSSNAPISSRSVQTDSLSEVIRSKKDAEDFMAELNSVIKRS